LRATLLRGNFEGQAVKAVATAIQGTNTYILRLLQLLVHRSEVSWDSIFYLDSAGSLSLA